MLNIIGRVRKLHLYSDPTPLLVHCSAGVGRTGTFIVLDSMLERMKTEESFNMLEFVQELRKKRVHTVQILVTHNMNVINFDRFQVGLGGTWPPSDSFHLTSALMSFAGCSDMVLWYIRM